MGFLSGASGKEPPASAGNIRDAVSSLGQEALLEEYVATRSSTLA